MTLIDINMTSAPAATTRPPPSHPSLVAPEESGTLEHHGPLVVQRAPAGSHVEVHDCPPLEHGGGALRRKDCSAAATSFIAIL